MSCRDGMVGVEEGFAKRRRVRPDRSAGVPLACEAEPGRNEAIALQSFNDVRGAIRSARQVAPTVSMSLRAAGRNGPDDRILDRAPAVD